MRPGQLRPRAERAAAEGGPEAGRAAVPGRGPPPASGWPRPALSTSSTPPRAPPGTSPGPGPRRPGPVAPAQVADRERDRDDRAGSGRDVRRGGPPRPGPPGQVDRAGRREQRPDPPDPRPGRRPRHHRHHHLRPDPRQRAPVGRRLVLSPQGQPRAPAPGSGTASPPCWTAAPAPPPPSPPPSARPPRGLGRGRRATASRTAGYLEAKPPTWTTPPPSPNGWPIATGVIEGACRHLVKDRMDIQAACWRGIVSVGVVVEELVDVDVVDAGEGAGRQRGQDVRVRPGRRPGHALPALGQRGRRRAGSSRRPGRANWVRVGRLPAAEPAGVLERHAEGDREAAVARAGRPGRRRSRCRTACRSTGSTARSGPPRRTPGGPTTAGTSAAPRSRRSRRPGRPRRRSRRPCR